MLLSPHLAEPVPCFTTLFYIEQGYLLNIKQCAKLYGFMRNYLKIIQINYLVLLAGIRYPNQVGMQLDHEAFLNYTAMTVPLKHLSISFYFPISLLILKYEHSECQY